MQEDIINYFRDFNNIFSRVVITNLVDKECDLTEGIEKAIGLIVTRAKSGNKMIFIGNGGSSSIASHMSTDFWKNGEIKAISFNDPAQLTCLSNDYGYSYVFEKPIRMFANSGDVLIAISSSGRSENIIRAVSAAKGIGCKVITMSGFKNDNPLRYSGGDLNFYVPSSSYGFVEVIHQAICHCILDLIIERKAQELVEETV